MLFCKFVVIILSIICYCGTFGLYRDIPLMKVSVRQDSENMQPQNRDYPAQIGIVGNYGMYTQ